MVIDFGPSIRKFTAWDAWCFRFGTFCKSGIEEAQYLYSLPEKPKRRNLQENQNYQGSLQEACR